MSSRRALATLFLGLALLAGCARGTSEQRVLSRGKESTTTTTSAVADVTTTTETPEPPTTATTAGSRPTTTSTRPAPPVPPDPCRTTTTERFPVPPVKSDTVVAAQVGEPSAAALAPDGSLWFTEWYVSAVFRMDGSGTVTTFDLEAERYPSSIAVAPNGDVWFTDPSRDEPAVGRLRDAEVAWFPLPTVASNPAMAIGHGSAPTAIILGPDGNMWFLEANADQVGRITADGTITEYPLPDSDRVHAAPGGMTVGSDGALWIAESLTNRIARLDPATGAFTEFPAGTGANNIGPGTPTSGPDGALWFNVGNSAIGRMTTSGAFKKFADAPRAAIVHWYWGAAAGPDGRIWFLDSNYGKVLRMTTRGVTSEVVTLPGKPLGESIGQIAVTGRSLWITAPRAKAIFRITCTG